MNILHAIHLLFLATLISPKNALAQEKTQSKTIRTQQPAKPSRSQDNPNQSVAPQSPSSSSRFKPFFASLDGGYTYMLLQNKIFPRTLALQGGQAGVSLGYAYTLFSRFRVSAASYSSYAYLGNRTEGHSDGSLATTFINFQSLSTGAQVGVEYIWRTIRAKGDAVCTLGVVNSWEEKISGTLAGMEVIGEFAVDLSSFLQCGGKISVEETLNNSTAVGLYVSTTGGLLGSHENTTDTFAVSAGLQASLFF
jgi:hypothetical protein